MNKSNQTLPTPFYVAWTTALLASAASVYFVEILHNALATFCWIDRMLMFGLFLILTVAIFDHDQRAKRYAVPFLAIGLPISLFQQLVHWNIIKIAPGICSTSYICTTKFFNLLGFIDQTTLCFAAFAIIAVALWLVKPAAKN